MEGAELTVLESIDFTRVSFGIMVVEADAHNHMKNLAMRKFLQSKGYLFLYDHGPNAWYANDNFYEIYKDLVY